jgi:hypothetical protein
MPDTPVEIGGYKVDIKPDNDRTVRALFEPGPERTEVSIVAANIAANMNFNGKVSGKTAYEMSPTPSGGWEVVFTYTPDIGAEPSASAGFVAEITALCGEMKHSYPTKRFLRTLAQIHGQAADAPSADTLKR